MRVIISGSRMLMDIGMVKAAVKQSGFEITAVLSGCSAGIDMCGELWARLNKCSIRQYPADWNRLGANAGPIRDKEMVENADALIAIPHPSFTSKSTFAIIDLAKKAGLKVFVYDIREGKGEFQ